MQLVIKNIIGEYWSQKFKYWGPLSLATVYTDYGQIPSDPGYFKFSIVDKEACDVN